MGTEEECGSYFKNRISNLDPIEGIWSLSSNTKNYDSYNRLLNNYDDDFHLLQGSVTLLR